MKTFKQRFTKQERIQKYKRQLGLHPHRIVIIAEKHPKSILPNFDNPKFLCQRNFKLMLIKRMLEAKIVNKTGSRQNENTQFFLFLNKKTPTQQQYDKTMDQIYKKYKDQDGLLYINYAEKRNMYWLQRNKKYLIFFFLLSLISLTFLRVKNKKKLIPKWIKSLYQIFKTVQYDPSTVSTEPKVLYLQNNNKGFLL